MKNSLLNFDSEDLGQFVVRDYFSANINIWEIFNEHKSMFEVYRIEDDDKIERISYELYGTTDYWDILIMLNDRSPLFEMPYNYDLLQNHAEEFINKYIHFVYSEASLADNNRKEELTAEMLNVNLENNEKFRYLHVVKPSKMGDFIKILQSKGYI